jgi:Rieske Fe-S protein
MAEKQEKGFMITKLKFIVVFTLLIVFEQCKRNTTTETIPLGPVSLTIDLNLPSNIHLNTVGNYSYFPGGIRGVLVIHDYDDNWYAYERTCAWEPLNECSTIWLDSQNLQLKCGSYTGNQFSKCCESSYIFSGFPIKGPAKGRLAQYKIQKNANLLYVYN